jgi:lysophospholipase L1-like esterase
MQRHSKKLWSLMLSCLLLVAVATSAFAAAPAAATTGTNYTALGDSIAFGVGATGYYGYVNDFRDYLNTVYGTVNLTNKGVPGATSTDLLTLLTSDSLTRTAVKNAQVLTISIGGNNLLRCASNNYNTIDTTCSATGVTNFKNDWTKILDTIRTSIGSTAKLYVMTLYNPYTGTDPNFATSDSYIKQINAVIQTSSNISTYNYRVADVYTDFSGKLADGTWKTASWTHFTETTRDPHPTDAGHKEMARLHQLIF